MVFVWTYLARGELNHTLIQVSVNDLTLLIIFMFQGRAIVDHPLDTVLIAIPLTLQTSFIFYIGYSTARKLCIRYEDAAPATLATVVGVLVEVPVMLTLVKIALKTQDRFKGE